MSGDGRFLAFEGVLAVEAYAEVVVVADCGVVAVVVGRDAFEAVGCSHLVVVVDWDTEAFVAVAEAVEIVGVCFEIRDVGWMEILGGL